VPALLNARSSLVFRYLPERGQVIGIRQAGRDASWCIAYRFGQLGELVFAARHAGNRRSPENLSL
jgi:hypothetical protein